MASGGAYELTVVFDSNITKITETISSNSVTTSGNSFSSDFPSGTITVTLNDGYVIDSVTITSGTVSGITDNSFSYDFSNDEIIEYYATVTITSKLSSTISRKSVDLTTLSGWSALSSGSHSITIIAKATGYINSAESASVTVTKQQATPEEPTEDELAGTWVFNETIDTESTAGFNTDTFAISFYDESEEDYEEFYFSNLNPETGEFDEIYYYGAGSIVAYAINPENPDFFPEGTEFPAWAQETYKKITITSNLSEVEYGDEFLKWLRENATKQDE